MSKKYIPIIVVLLLISAPRLSGQTVPTGSEEQVNKLIAVVKSDAPHKEKVDACRQLAVVGTKDAVPALAALLGDEKLGHMARYGLEPIPDPAVDDALRDALGKVKGRPLVGVIGSLGVRRDTKAVPLLMPLMRNSDAEVARAAARSLGKIGGAESLKALIAALSSDSAGALRPAVADACLSCAEALLAAGKTDEAAKVYESVGKADLPKHFRIAAMQGAILARKK